MLSFAKKIKHNQYGGALMFLLGSAIAARSIEYKIGTISRMGPGLFPAAVGALLALTGIGILLPNQTGTPETVESHNRFSDWRGWVLISLSIIAFIVLGVYGGLVPATFAIVFISALADRDNTVLDALLLSIAMVVVCVIVFWWLLQVQFPLFRWG